MSKHICYTSYCDCKECAAREAAMKPNRDTLRQVTCCTVYGSEPDGSAHMTVILRDGSKIVLTMPEVFD